MPEITTPVGDVAAAAAEAVQDVVDEAEAATREAERLAHIESSVAVASGEAYDAKAGVESLRSEMHETIRAAVEEIKGAMQPVVDAAEDAAESVEDAADTVADAAVDTTTDLAGDVVETAGDVIEAGAGAATDGIDAAEETAEAAPRRAHFLLRPISDFFGHH